MPGTSKGWTRAGSGAAVSGCVEFGLCEEGGVCLPRVLHSPSDGGCSEARGSLAGWFLPILRCWHSQAQGCATCRAAEASAWDRGMAAEAGGTVLGWCPRSREPALLLWVRVPCPVIAFAPLPPCKEGHKSYRLRTLLPRSYHLWPVSSKGLLRYIRLHKESRVDLLPFIPAGVFPYLNNRWLRPQPG